jgi:hypothetical protein
MPVTNPILVRTLLGYQESLNARAGKNGGTPDIEIVCNCWGCKVQIPKPNDWRIFISREFRCFACFANIVRCQKRSFGVSEDATDEEIRNLLKPSTVLPVPNLFELKDVPPFLCMEDGKETA